nr:PREDICTED: uncharacterized protein LOC108952646 [Musa acuminata subsp. malaccensis]
MHHLCADLFADCGYGGDTRICPITLSLVRASGHRGVSLVVGDLAISYGAQLMALPGGLPRGMLKRGDRPDSNAFLDVFSLVQGSRRDYLTAQSGFNVSGTPCNNKGWKARHFFVSYSRGWGFNVGWTSQVINNVPPFLSFEEAGRVGCLREILSSSQAIRGTSEEWLVEVGLSPAPREMVNLKSLKGMLRSSVMTQPSREGNKRNSEVPVRKSTSVRQTGSLKEAKVGWPKKKPKVRTRKDSEGGDQGDCGSWNVRVGWPLARQGLDERSRKGTCCVFR